MLRKINPYIEILRPVNFIIAFLSIYFSIVISNNILKFQLIAFLGSLAGALIGGAGMIINDYFDEEIDMINRPERPIPSGKISKKNAVIYYLSLNILALIILFFINKYAFIVGLFSELIIFLYSSHLKRTVLIGNFTVAFMTGLAFIFGGIIAGSLKNILFLSAFAFLANFGREVLKDLEDVEGDKAKGIKTFPIVFGEKKSLVLISITWLLLIGVTLLPYALGVYNRYYMVLIILFVDVIFLWLIRSIWKNSYKDNLRFISQIVKYEMLIGLLIVYIGTL